MCVLDNDVYLYFQQNARTLSFYFNQVNKLNHENPLFLFYLFLLVGVRIMSQILLCISDTVFTIYVDDFNRVSVHPCIHSAQLQFCIPICAYCQNLHFKVMGMRMFLFKNKKYVF